MDGEVRDVSPEGEQWSMAVDINNAGQALVVTETEWYLWEDGAFTPAGTTDREFYSHLWPAFSLNDQGQVSGFFDDPEGTTGFLWSPSSGYEIPEPGKSVSGINRFGQVCLILDNPTLWPSDLAYEKVESFSTLNWGRVYGLNASGTMVGRETALTDARAAYVGYCGALYELDGKFGDSDWSYLWPRAVREDGLIVGYGQHGGVQRAFIATPVY